MFVEQQSKTKGEMTPLPAFSHFDWETHDQIAQSHGSPPSQSYQQIFLKYRYFPDSIVTFFRMSPKLNVCKTWG